MSWSRPTISEAFGPKLSVMSRPPAPQVPSPPRPRLRAYGSVWGGRAVVLLLAFQALVMLAIGAEHLTVLDAGAGPPAGTATVTGAEVRRGARGYESAWVTFRHGDVTSSCMVPVAEIGTFRPGQEQPYWVERGLARTLTLLDACAGRERREAQRLLVLVLVLAPLLVAGAVLAHRSTRRRHRLLTEGPAAEGKVTAVDFGPRGRVTLGLEIGAPVSFIGTRVIHGHLLKALGAGRVPSPGERVYVVHDRQDPARFEIWGFESPR
jgi:hypothetical protein